MEMVIGILGVALSVAIIVAGIWMLVLAFKESIGQGLLSVFIPFYILWYVFSRWPRCKKPFLVLLSALPSMFILAVVSTRMLRNPETARTSLAHAQIAMLITALQAYRVDTGVFPNTEEGLQGLRVRPANANRWNGPYVKEIPLDPWGQTYVYKYPSDHGEEPDVISYGADGQPGGDGMNADIASWKRQ